VGVVLFKLMRAYLRYKPDTAWAPTGFTYSFTGDDEQKRVSALKAAQKHDISKRKLHALRGKA